MDISLSRLRRLTLYFGYGSDSIRTHYFVSQEEIVTFVKNAVSMSEAPSQFLPAEWPNRELTSIVQAVPTLSQLEWRGPGISQTHVLSVVSFEMEEVIWRRRSRPAAA